MTVLAEIGHVVIWAVVFWVVSHVLDALKQRLMLRAYDARVRRRR
jgi:hypothetical protein